MGDLLKNMRSSQIFSVCGLPDVAVTKHTNGRYQVELVGLDVSIQSRWRTIMPRATMYPPGYSIRITTACASVPGTTIILETKGFDPLAEVKSSAAARWVNAVNAEGSHGRWRYELARNVSSVGEKIGVIPQ